MLCGAGESAYRRSTARVLSHTCAHTHISYSWVQSPVINFSSELWPSDASVFWLASCLLVPGCIKGNKQVGAGAVLA